MKVKLTLKEIEDGNYEELLDQIDKDADGLRPGESRTVNIELTIKNDETEVDDETETEGEENNG